MAQRNPMNDRYAGDGPVGKTKRSAAKAKPVTAAASSVHIKNKPTTKQEKKAAAKQREKQAQAKAAERARKAAEREAAEKAAAGEPVPQPAKPKQPSFLKSFFKPNPNAPDTPEYHRWRRVYWGFLAVGLVCVAVSWFLMNQQFPAEWPMHPYVITLAGAYIFVIGGFVVDYAKVKPLVKKHVGGGADGKKSPKQLKHEQEQAERLARIEADRKAARAAKRRKIIRKKDTEQADLGLPE